MTVQTDHLAIRRRRTAPSILPQSGWTAPLVTFTAVAMSFLTVLALAASMAANNLADAWRADLAGVATVRFSAAEDEHGDKLRAVLEVLRTTPGISQVRVLSDTEQAALIAPWLGEGAELNGLPTPRLIDVTLEGAGPDAMALQQRLDLTVTGVVYDDHAAWRGPLTAAARALEWLALAAALLVLATAGAVVAFSARATLAANRHVIQTVRLVGAEDSFIAGAFIAGLTRRGAVGSLIGAAIGCVILGLMPRLEAAQDAAGVALGPGWFGWLVLLLGVPLAMTAITWLAGRASVRMTLAQMP